MTSSVRARIGAATLAVLVVFASFILPSTSASAKAIDCSYTDGLADFISRLHDENLTCLREPPGSTKGGGSTGERAGNGIGGAARSQVTACTYPVPDMPDWLYANGTVTAQYLPPVYFPDPAGTDDVLADYRTEYRDSGNRRFATRDYVVSTKRALTVPARMYLHDFNPVHFPAAVSQTWSCDHEDWFAPQFTDMSPRTGPAPVSVPAVSANWSPSPLQATSSIGPVPTRPGSYFYRVDATNSSTTRAYPAILSIDLSAYAIDGVLSLPAGGSCPAWTPGIETCTATSILPGQTVTFTFLVRATAVADAPVPLSTQVDTFANSTPNPRPYPSVLGSWTAVAPAVP